MVQEFDDLYHCQTMEEAEREFIKLTSWIMHSRLTSMKRVTQSLRRKRTEILEYFRNRLTNAFAEGMNSLIQAAKRKSRGFRTFTGFRNMIFLAVGKLQLCYPCSLPK